MIFNVCMELRPLLSQPFTVTATVVEEALTRACCALVGGDDKCFSKVASRVVPTFYHQAMSAG